MQYSSRPNTSPRQQNGRPRQQQRATPSATNQRGEPLKFEGEFDFEQANARFEQEIEKEFDKLKIGDSTKSAGKENKQDTSMSQSHSMSLQEMQDQQHILMKQKSLNSDSLDHQKPMDMQKHMENLVNKLGKDEEDMKNFYDKNISFFDRISCESNDKLQNQKPKNWKEERKINAETFGLQQRQNEMKSSYNRNYNNYGHRSNNYQSAQNGRNYPRNNYLNGSINQPQSHYRGNNSSSNQNSSSRPNQRVSSGYNGNNNNMRSNNNNQGYNSNYRRQEVEVNSSRRFGSR
jgi:protein LSM14